ncbi:MAG: Gfo/Idh/MocA family oxidoreductase [Magnetococcus sp. YQC-5]
MFNIGVALIGTSGIAARHVASLQKIPHVTLRWIVSRDLARAERFAQKLGIQKGTNRLELALDDPSVHVVMIFTEPMRHVNLALLALQAGKDLLIEKPLDVDPVKGELLLEAALGSNQVIGIVSPYRFEPALIEMKQRLDSEARDLPKLASLRCLWPRNQHYYEQGNGWRMDYSPFFLNQGIHWLDALNGLFGSPLRVCATSRVTRPFLRCADMSAALIDYPGEVTAVVSGGSFGTTKEPDHFSVVYPGGMLDFQKLKGSPPPNTLREHMARLILRQPVGNHPVTDTAFLVCKDFINAVRTRGQPGATLADGWKALRLAHQISHLNT